eukprot:CAMPEP_0180797274 /NCGR_PEP_ID=MMETSP1038_2-20121128/57281_1 /TAXON_ID=632150 /ORGANISM="Azadinium spinosum, Strain 3D9" /LENGTH=43 /DNA_ID= /DNA_START= /DNA_END= /DNA_ORIENTATION=
MTFSGDGATTSMIPFSAMVAPTATAASPRDKPGAGAGAGACAT